MSRGFNGSSDRMTASPDFSAYSLLTVSAWLWWDTNANDDDFAMEYGGSFVTQSGFVWDHNSSSGGGGGVEIGMGLAAGSARWTDKFTRPSAAAWHHYLFVFNRATPVNKAWVDGGSQTLTAVTHNAGTYGNFGNATMFLMHRTGPTLLGAGKQAEVTVWGGVELGTRESASLTAGAPPEMVHPDGIVWRVPLWGTDSPEPDYSGRRKTVTVTAGTTPANHPPISPGLSRAVRRYQPVPV